MKKSKDFDRKFALVSCLIAISFFLTSFAGAIAQQVISPDEIQLEGDEFEYEEVSGTNPPRDETSLKIGPHEFKFVRDIAAWGGMARFRVLWFGTPIYQGAAAAGSEIKKVTLFSQDVKLYDYWFSAYHIKYHEYSSTWWDYVSHIFGETRTESGSTSGVAQKSLRVEKELPPVTKEFSAETFWGPIKFGLNISINVISRVDPHLQFNFSPDGVGAKGKLESFALYSFKIQPFMVSTPPFFPMIRHFEVTGMVRIEDLDTDYNVDANPRVTALSGSASSDVNKWTLKSSGKVVLIAPLPFEAPAGMPPLDRTFLFDLPDVEYEGASSKVTLYSR